MNREKDIVSLFADKSFSMSSKINMIRELEKSPSAESYMLLQKVTTSKGKVDTSDTSESGFYGNVWIRKQKYKTTATVHDGHTHDHDHMSLVNGKVLVEVEGCEPKEFSDTFFIVNANKHHKITALEDNTTVFCIFAIRDSDGKSADEYYAEGNSPYEYGKKI